MLNSMKIIYFLLFFIFSCSSTNNFDNKLKTSVLTFEVNKLFFDDNKMNLELFLKIPINILVFNKKIDSFNSLLTVDILINDVNNKNIYSHSWDENIHLDFYEDTKSSKKHLLKHAFSLSEGEYSIKIIVNDFINHLSFINEGDFIIKKNDSFSKELELYYKKNNEYLYYVSDTKIDSVDTLWFNFGEVEDSKSQHMKLDYEFYFKNNLVEKGNVFDSKKEDFIYKDFYPIPLIKKSFDKLKIELRYNDMVESSSFYFEDRIYNNYDLSILVGPMQYVMSFSDYMSFSDLNIEDQKEYIKNFWDINNTQDLSKLPYNKFYEFYNRVDYSNKTFKFFKNEGWKSDQGKIYIIHGKPKEVTYDFNERGEFEIWFYNTSKSFIFINRYGTYELYDRNF